MKMQINREKDNRSTNLVKRIGSVVVILALVLSMPAFALAADYLGKWTLSSNTRLAGTDRFGTSEKAMDYIISKHIQNPMCFVVASGANYPDALSGSFLAAEKNAPLVLTSKGQDSNVLEKIKSKVKKPAECEIFLLGGTAAVSAEFENMAKEAGFKVTRLGGSDRYGTNIEILKELDAQYEPLLICSGQGYADALSASAVNMPIMLVGDKLTSAQKSILSKEKNRFIYIIGGTAAVSSNI